MDGLIGVLGSVALLPHYKLHPESDRGWRQVGHNWTRDVLYNLAPFIFKGHSVRMSCLIGEEDERVMLFVPPF